MNEIIHGHRDPIVGKLPGLDCHYDVVIANDLRRHGEGAPLKAAMQDGARAMAELIVREPKFFSVKELEGGLALHVRGDAYVLTAEQLRSELAAAYSRGVNEGWRLR